MSSIQVSEFEKDRVVIDSQMMHKNGIEGIPGSSYRGKGLNKWTLPRTHTALAMLKGTFPDVQFDAQLDVWYEAEDAKVDSIFGLINDGLPQEVRDAIQTKLLPEGFHARPYQTDAAVYLNAVGGGGVFDQQGLGKTLTVAMALMLYPGNYPALIISPKAVLWTWQRELKVLGINSIILHGTAAQRRKILSNYDPDETPVMITTYDTVKAHSKLSGYGNIALKRCVSCGGKNPELDPSKCEVCVRELNKIPWVTTVLDEGHRCRFPKSATTRAVWAVSSGCKNRWVLTGTPVEQNPMEMWALLRFSSPSDWPTSVKHRDRYVLTFNNFFGGIDILGLRPEAMEEYKRLAGYRFMRRVHAPGTLPDLTNEYRYCELSPKERRAYNQMAKQLMLLTEDDNVIEAENHMVKQGRLIQAANSLLEVGSDDKVYPCEPSSKLDLFMDTLQDFAEDEPIIVWFKHTGLLKMASERLKAANRPHEAVYGNLDAKKVDDAVQRFQSGESNMFLSTIKKGGTGITLTRSRVAIYVQVEESLIEHDQSVFRNRRIGSEIHMDQGILHIYLVALATAEEEIHETKLPAKYEKSAEVVER